MVPKLFGPIRERYLNRPGGYTRVLRIEPMKEDQAESAILELVDGPKDMRFALTAKILSRLPQKKPFSPAVASHVQKVTQFREDGVEQLQEMVERMRVEQANGMDDRVLPPPRKVYPEIKMKRDMHYFEEVDNYKYPNALPRRKTEAKKEVVKHDVEVGVVEAEQTPKEGGQKQIA